MGLFSNDYNSTLAFFLCFMHKHNLDFYSLDSLSDNFQSVSVLLEPDFIFNLYIGRSRIIFSFHTWFFGNVQDDLNLFSGFGLFKKEGRIYRRCRNFISFIAFEFYLIAAFYCGTGDCLIFTLSRPTRRLEKGGLFLSQQCISL